MFLRFLIKFLYNAGSYFCILDMDCCICLSFGHTTVYYWITYRLLIAFNTHSQICSRCTAVNVGYTCSQFEAIRDLPELCCKHRRCFMNWWQCCWIPCLLLCLLSTPQETPNPSNVVAGTMNQQCMLSILGTCDYCEGAIRSCPSEFRWANICENEKWKGTERKTSCK